MLEASYQEWGGETLYVFGLRNVNIEAATDVAQEGMVVVISKTTDDMAIAVTWNRKDRYLA